MICWHFIYIFCDKLLLLYSFSVGSYIRVLIVIIWHYLLAWRLPVCLTSVVWHFSRFVCLKSFSVVLYSFDTNSEWTQHSISGSCIHLTYSCLASHIYWNTLCVLNAVNIITLYYSFQCLYPLINIFNALISVSQEMILAIPGVYIIGISITLLYLSQKCVSNVRNITKLTVGINIHPLVGV